MEFMNSCAWCVIGKGLFGLAIFGLGGDLARGGETPVPFHGMVASGHPVATRAGVAAMKAGGNAMDAAVAVGLTLGVVDGHNSGIGGGCFMLVRTAGGEIVALDGREMAPQAVTRETYLHEGKAVPERSRTGALAVGIPGSLMVYDQAASRFGRGNLRDSLLRAARLAEEGFRIDSLYARRLTEQAEELRRFPEARRIFLDAEGRPWPEGHLLRQPDLAQSYRAIAKQGIEWFYGGEFAAVTAAWMAENNGLITVEDFRNYRMRHRTPVRSRYRGYEVVGFPPPSSGGVHVAQILNILEHFNLAAMDANSADFIHVVTEAMKRAFADRAYWLGDPDFAQVPRGLIDPAYGERLARQIDMESATAVEAHGMPPGAEEAFFGGGHTTHFATADGAGNWVACTATVNTSFGSNVVIPGTGIVMNNQMDDFSLQPGVPNFFGLIGAEANAVAPGKRPLSSMSPTLVFRDGEPVFSVGAAGGPTIISQAVQVIIQMVDFGVNVEEALAQSRFHHQWRPDVLRVEPAVSDSIVRELERRGHRVERADSIGVSQIVARDEDGRFTGAADPRGAGMAEGF